MKRSTFVVATTPIVVLWVLFSMVATTDPQLAHPMIQALVPAIWLGVPLAGAAVIVAHRLSAVAEGPDFPARLLSVTTTGLPGRRSDWGTAMRAELESIDDPLQRRRFAFGCSFASVRSRFDRATLLVALSAAGLVAAGTLIVSRVSLANGRSGVFVYAYLFPIVVLTFTGLANARRSVSRGLVTGFAALGFALVSLLAVQVAEAGHWFDTYGIHIVDGDPPPAVPTRAEIYLDPLSPHFVAFYLLMWLPWPVFGAAIGWKWLRNPQPIDETSASLI